MQVTETLSEGLKRGFAITVPAADIEDKRTKRLAELGKTVKLPGFRPGKVPMTVVRQRYGTAVMAEVLEESVNEATQQVLTDRGLRAASQPKVDVTQLADEKQDLEFTVELELLPEIPMPDFAGIELTRLKAEPADEAVDKALDEIAARQRELEPVTEDRGAADRRHADRRFRRQGRRRAVPGRRRHRHGGRARRRGLHPRLHRGHGGHAARRGAPDRRHLPRGLPRQGPGR